MHDRSLIVQCGITTIVVLRSACEVVSFTPSTPPAMTTGRKYVKRTKETTDQRVLDARTRSVLNAVITEPRGRALEAYLRALGQRRPE